MPTRIETLTVVTRIFNTAVYPQSEATLNSAWLGIYQALLWYEPINTLPDRNGLPHIIDANRLTLKPTKKGEPKAWQKYAIAVEEYVAVRLGVQPSQVSEMVDRLMKLPAYQGLQRHNILGSAFAGLLKHVLEQTGLSTVTYELEVNGNRAFPGVALPTEPVNHSLIYWFGRMGVMSG